MKSFLASLALILPLMGMAQQVLLQDSRQAGKPMESNMGVEIEGSVFLFEQPSILLVAVKNTTNFLKITNGRFNALLDRFEYEMDGKSLFLDPALYNKVFMIIAGDTLVFKNGLTEKSPYSKKSYFHVLAEGQSVWVKKPVKSLVTSPDAAYGSTKQKAVQDEVFFYVVDAQGDLEKFKPSKKYFAKRYPQWEVDINTFIKEKAINFDRDADLRKFIGWIEAKR